MITRIVYPGELVYGYGITEEDLLSKIQEGRPFRVQRMLAGRPERIVTLFPQHIASFFPDEQ